MDSLTRSLNFELPHEMHFNKYAQQVLESSSKSAARTASSQAPVYASTPTITTFDALANNDFLQKFGASILNSIQLKHRTESATDPSEQAAAANMDLDMTPNRVMIDSSSFNAIDELQKQLEYDKFMNEVWIGIVFTLIVISMVFCICSCFLYHQFRTWKRNYNNSNNSVHCHVADGIESLKLQNDVEDPVPEYTLVSGLPSYEDALELLHKTKQSCLIAYPSVINVFGKQVPMAAAAPATALAAATAAQQQEQQQIHDVTTPLLSVGTTTTTTTTQAQANDSTKANLGPIPSYTEVINLKTIDAKPTTTTTKAPTTASAVTTTLPMLLVQTALRSPKSESSLCVLTYKSEKL